MKLNDYEMAQATISQQKKRYKVKKRSYVPTPFLATFIAVAIAVSGMVYAIVDTNKKVKAFGPIDKQEMQQYIDENMKLDPFSAEAKGLITDDVKEAASAQYDKEQELISPVRIANLREGMYQEYSTLLGLMNSNLQINDIKDGEYDANRITDVQKSYEAFNQQNEADKTDYYDANETVKMNKAYDLYATKLQLLQIKAQELTFASRYLNPNSDELKQNNEDFKNNATEIKKILENFKTLSDMGLPVYVDREEDAASR